MLFLEIELNVMTSTNGHLILWVHSLIKSLFTNRLCNKIIKSYKNAKRRLLLLDYDGTLVGFTESPDKAIPSKPLLELIENISKHENTDLVIISGRPHTFLDKYFSHLNIILVAEHGLYIKQIGSEWYEKKGLSNEWIEHLLPILDTFTDNTPGTFIEQKTNSLAWHYRKADPELGINRSVELKTVLKSLLPNGLTLLDGNKVLELIPSNINKGATALDMINQKKYDFSLAAGDDTTDENMFLNLPSQTFKIKIGKKKTAAKYYIRNFSQFITLLNLISHERVNKSEATKQIDSLNK